MKKKVEKRINKAVKAKQHHHKVNKDMFIGLLR